MWLERLGWAAAIAVLGALPAFWIALKVIVWRDKRRGLVDDVLPGPPHHTRGVDYRRF